MDHIREAQPADDSDVLVLIPTADLHLVQGQRDNFVEKGPLSVHVSSNQTGSVITAKVGGTAWPLERTTPTLKTAEYAYVFAVQGGTAFYSILLSTGTPDTDQALFEEILVECTAFQLAGALSEDAIREAVKDVTEAVLRDGSASSGLSASSSPTAAGTEAAVLAVAAAQRERPAANIGLAQEQPPSSSEAATPPQASAQQQPPSDTPPAAEAPPPYAQAGPSHTDRIAAGTAKVQEAIAISAGWASQKIMEQSRRWQQQIKPAAESIKISPELKARIRMGRDVAKQGAHMAGRVSQKAADISVRVAESIVRHVGEASTAFGEHLAAGGSSRTAAAQEIAAASLVAAVEIYGSMEEAARVVIASSGQATSDLIGHKYGDDAGEVTLHAAETATHAATAGMRLRTVGIRSIARRIAKHTSVGFARAATQRPQPPGSPQPQGPGQPLQRVPEGQPLPRAGRQQQPPQQQQPGRRQPQPLASTATAAATPSGPVSPFATAPKNILPPDPPPPAVQPSGPLSPFALAQTAPEEPERTPSEELGGTPLAASLQKSS